MEVNFYVRLAYHILPYDARRKLWEEAKTALDSNEIVRDPMLKVAVADVSRVRNMHRFSEFVARSGSRPMLLREKRKAFGRTARLERALANGRTACVAAHTRNI